jgi:hypothetical protein
MEFNLFRFFISGVKKEVLPDSRLWQLPLSGGNNRKSCDSDFTTGDYFLAASVFLSKNKFSFLNTALNCVVDKSVQNTSSQNKSTHDELIKIDQVVQVNIFLEKHGAFYHPLKIQVILKDRQTCYFVLNGAVSSQGLSLIQDEYTLLSEINQAYPKQYLPKIFGFDFIRTDRGRAGFFLGFWFENFKEFHVSDDNDCRQISMWESDGSCNYIEIINALEIYKKISKILTYYYNLETFEQILSWHHAAGDFIVKQENGRFSVKLITIRKYSRLTELGAGEDDQATFILPSLLLFFLNLTIKMRIDRLNGTGKLIMIEQSVIDSTIKGFLSVLDEKSTMYNYGDLRSAFIEFFLQFNIEQIRTIVENSVESNCSDPLEVSLIQKNLKAHCKALHSILKNI